MNEEISVTLVNNTASVQPVTLFTEQFAIPNNLTGGQTKIYSWDLSSESFFYYNSISYFASLQYSTSPITQTTPTTNVNYTPNNISGLVIALNSLGIGTFTSNGSILSVTSSTYYFGTLSLSPEIYIDVTSSTPDFLPAILLTVNGSTIATIPSGVNQLNQIQGNFNDNDIVQVQFNIGAGALSWGIIIDNYLPSPSPPINIFNQSGSGSFSGSYTFSYPDSGNLLILLGITP